jgi:hypothetical protein
MFMSYNDDVIEDSAAVKPTATEKVVEDIVEETGVEVKNVKVEEAKTEDDKNVISGPEKPKRKPASNVTNNEDGVFGSKAADRPIKKIIPSDGEKKQNNKVALWSNKNIRWDGIGTLKKGYNIVNKEASEKWLTRNGIRIASAEEVATYYGK